MTTSIEEFGLTADGETVERITLIGGGLMAKVMTWGAVLQDLRLEDHKAPLVLGFPKFETYPEHSPYFGAIAGRVANRIAHGRYSVGDKTFQLDQNMPGGHTLHGGSMGVGKRLWSIADVGSRHVTLTLHDPDGMMGFGGACDMTCEYTLKDNGTLSVALTSRVDQAGPVNLTHHSYFALDDTGDCRNLHMRIAADKITAVDEDMIVTGETPSVHGTAFDFSATRLVSAAMPPVGFFDHNFCLRDQRGNLQESALAFSPASKVEMRVFTTEPGVQFYAGHKLNTPAGLTGQPYKAHAGFCMEAQNWPDAVNHKHFPEAIVQPDEPLRQVTEYRVKKR
ncbi:MAG: aldose epimerase family protein [Pseudomonadota bacterium]